MKKLISLFALVPMIWFIGCDATGPDTLQSLGTDVPGVDVGVKKDVDVNVGDAVDVKADNKVDVNVGDGVEVGVDKNVGVNVGNGVNVGSEKNVNVKVDQATIDAGVSLGISILKGFKKFAGKKCLKCSKCADCTDCANCTDCTKCPDCPDCAVTDTSTGS